MYKSFQQLDYFVLAFSESNSTLPVRSGWSDNNSKYQKPLQGRDGRDGIPGPHGPTGRDGANGKDGKKGRKGAKGERGGRGAPGPKKKGVVYTHWGKDNCSDIAIGTELLYAGRVAGQYYGNYGGGANYLCLPEKDAEYLNTTYKGDQASLYGTEYEIPIIPSVLQNENVPCAVCYTSTKTVQVMIPAKTTCPLSWTVEYAGYLMTEHRGHPNNKGYICVDKYSEPVPNSVGNDNGALLYHVTATCTGIPCPPYATNQYITCVVCTK